jgi:hypothetical protein
MNHGFSTLAGLIVVFVFLLFSLVEIDELAYLISGSAELVDVNDLRAHVQYAGGYAAEDAYIVGFWEVQRLDRGRVSLSQLFPCIFADCRKF